MKSANQSERLERERDSGGHVRPGFIKVCGITRLVDALDAMLANKGIALDAVLQLTADDDELVARLLKRAQIEGRADDTEEVIRHRLGLYNDETRVVVERYEERGIVRKVDGLGAIDEVTERVLAALNVNA